MIDDGERRNQTMELLLGRASCRNFADRTVPPEILQQVLEAGVHAPTAGNFQPYSIIKIEKQQTRQTLAELAGGQGYVAKAPVNLMFCIDWHRIERWAELEVAPFTATASFRHFWLSFQDTVICAQNICTAADSLGLGSVYIGTIIEAFAELRDLLRLPQGVFPVVLLCLGYPASMPRPARKLGPQVVVHDETYREMDDDELLTAFDEKYHDRDRQITDERIEKISEVCRETHGEEFARRCLERIQQNGHIGPVQTYFGLHYCANTVPQGNEDYLKFMEEFGFRWFQPYRPAGDQAS